MKLSMALFLKYLVLLFVFLPIVLLAQVSPVEWGEITKADLEMKSFPVDTNAAAVILSDFGESHFDNDLNIEYNRHLRVKVFSSKGYELATHSVSVFSHNGIESIYDIEGVTYSLNSDGEIVKNKLKSKDVFEEEINGGRTLYKFTMPGLTQGCIFEIRYKIISENPWLIRDWVFQYSEPALWSEYCVKTPKAIAYTSIRRGYELFTVCDEIDTVQNFMGVAKSYFGKNVAPCLLRRWVLKDAPALRDEPFITTISDYANKVELQLSGYAMMGGGKVDVLNDWKSFVNELAEDSDFGEMIEDTREVREQASIITKGLLTPEDKVKAVYNWVANSIVCTGPNRMRADKDVDNILEFKKGSNAEITFLLLSLLKSIGINGDPVILSTRDNGKVQELYPIVGQFNYVMARVRIGNNVFYLDATDHLRPIDILPKKVLNVKGLVIKKDAVEWVVLTSEKCDIKNSFADLKIKGDGTITGSVEYSFSEYGSLYFRNELSGKKDIEVAKNLLEDEKSEMTIDSVSINVNDSLQMPIKLKAWFTISNYAQISGDIIYINPQIIDRFKDNPFKTLIRKFPVNYPHKISYLNVINITLPDSLEINGKSNNQSLSAAANGILYTRRVQTDKNKIQIFNKFEVKQIEIKPQFYSQLKEFYAKIVAAQSEQLVISRKGKSLDTVQDEILKK